MVWEKSQTAVFKFFSQYYNNLRFYWATIYVYKILYEILISIMAFIAIYAIKVSVWIQFIV